MTGIFSNDTYNNGVTRDNFEQYAHTYYNPRDPYNSDYNIVNNNNNNNSEPALPKTPATPPKKPRNNNNNNNNKGNNNSKAKVLGALFFLAIIIFVALFSLKMYYAAEEINYYQGKIDDANQRLAQFNSNMILPLAYGQQQEGGEFFIITDDKIEVVIEASEIIESLVNFEQWCDDNFNTHAPQCYYVLYDFLNNNKQLTTQIENVMNE